MDLEKLIKLILANPNNINILYSNINGKESLTVNGKELVEESNVKKEIEAFKNDWSLLDDDVVNNVIDKVSEVICLDCLNKLLDKEVLDNEEATECLELMNIVKRQIYDELGAKIIYLNALKERFE